MFYVIGAAVIFGGAITAIAFTFAELAAQRVRISQALRGELGE